MAMTMSNTQRLKDIHRAMVENQATFYAIPEGNRCDAVGDPIRERSEALFAEAEAMLPRPEVPAGFYWGLPDKPGDCSYGILMLPDAITPVALWGKLLHFKNINAVLNPYGLEYRTVFGDFVICKIGGSKIRDLALRIRLVGPQTDSLTRMAEVEHLFSAPVGPHVRFEYDETFFGGDYKKVGQFAYVPLGLIEHAETPEKAFADCTKVAPIHIIHYTLDELYTAEGNEFSEDDNGED
jgi:hypothetical protein